MQAIINIKYNEDKHSLLTFFQTYFKPLIFPMVSHSVVGKIMNGRTMVEAMEQLMILDWRTMRLVKKVSSGQRTTVDLGDGTRVSINLLKSPDGDKAIMMVTSTQNDSKEFEIDYMVMAYSGSEEVFKEYLHELSIPELVAYDPDNLIHFEDDKVETL